MSKLPALATSALLTSCIATDGGADGAVFERVVIAETGVKLGGCAVGDLDPSHEGPEIAAVGEDGSVHVAWREDGSWRSAVVARCGGEMIHCAIGYRKSTLLNSIH